MSDLGPFSRSSLETEGFVGWRAFSDLDQHQPPRAPGVYIIHRAAREPAFLSASQGGWFKGKDPTVSKQVLQLKWVDGASVIYIGKANDLRARIDQYGKFGAGKPIGHWGGRLIWQMSGCDGHLVAWKETPDQSPRAVEKRMIEDFRTQYGKAPFANEPHRPGK